MDRSFCCQTMHDLAVFALWSVKFRCPAWPYEPSWMGKYWCIAELADKSTLSLLDWVGHIDHLGQIVYQAGWGQISYCGVVSLEWEVHLCVIAV